jgi:MauM/NapG family ferredoxin protein
MLPLPKILLLIRRLVQALSVFLLLFIIWNTKFPLSGFINPRFYFMVDPLAMYATSMAERVLLGGLIYSTLLLISTFILGRGFCGFICPLGALQDFIAALKGIFLRWTGIRTKEGAPMRLRLLKYFILFAIMAAALFGVQFAWFLDPITIFVRTFSFNVHPFLNGTIDTAITHLDAAAGYPEALESFYDWLREGFLSLTTPEFPHTNIILVIMAVILILTLVKRRFWCRYICPLGGMLALPSLAPLLRRDVHSCKKNCGVCKNICRMNAIKEDNSYLAAECILCLDCMVKCPNENSTFSMKKSLVPAVPPKRPGTLISRAQFLSALMGTIFASIGIAAAPQTVALQAPRSGTASRLRPPGALPEREFIQRCIRCGNCMKVCPTNVLTPSPISLDPRDAWSPVMDTRRGYCEYQCNLCGRVCPTEAIAELTVEQKKKMKIGIAAFNKKICIPYAKGENCIVCEEHCPVPNKAIKLRRTLVKGKTVNLPVIDESLCIGCVICEFKCPTSPDKGVVVNKIEYSSK